VASEYGIDGVTGEKHGGKCPGVKERVRSLWSSKQRLVEPDPGDRIEESRSNKKGGDWRILGGKVIKIFGCIIHKH